MAMTREAYRRAAAEFADWLVQLPKGKRTLNDGIVRGNCPKSDHEDKNPSFAYMIEGDCWSCSCGSGKASELRRIIGYVSKSALTPSIPPRIIAEYNYTDESGTVLYQCIRWDRGPRKFQQRRPSPEGGWIWNLDDVQLQLYKLPELIASPKDKPVLIVEGEKDVETAIRLGFTATCNPMGALKWKLGGDEYTKHFKDRTVIIIPDNDNLDGSGKDVGIRHAYQVYEAVKKVAANAYISPYVQVGKDFTDWVEAGATAQDIQRFIERAIKSETPKLPEESKDEEDPTPWMVKKTFHPSVVADILISKHHFLTSPIDRAGVGVTLHIYRDGVYRSDGCSFARVLIDKMLAHDSKPDRIESVLDLIKERTKKPMEQLNIKAMDFLNVENGMLNWRTGELIDHSPEYLSTIRFPVKYDKDAKSDLLDTFITEVLPPDVWPFFYEWCGYVLIPSTKLQTAVVLTGEGLNGKSVTISMVQHLIGQENVTNIPLQQLEENRFAVARLVGKLGNFFPDLDARSLQSSATFKAIASGDMITGEDKYVSSFSFRPIARMFFSANRIPKCSDRTFAFIRRLKIIPFPHKVRKPDLDLERKITKPEVLSYLLNHAIAGLKRLEEQGGFTPSKSMDDALTTYRQENDSVVAFINECVESVGGSSEMIGKQDVFDAYTAWCERNHCGSGTSREFNARMAEVTSAVEGNRMYNGKQTKVWVGIRYKPDPDIVEIQSQMMPYVVPIVDKGLM